MFKTLVNYIIFFQFFFILVPLSFSLILNSHNFSFSFRFHHFRTFCTTTFLHPNLFFYEMVGESEQNCQDQAPHILIIIIVQHNTTQHNSSNTYTISYIIPNQMCKVLICDHLPGLKYYKIYLLICFLEVVMKTSTEKTEHDHETLTRCCLNAVSPSATLIQHQKNIGPKSYCVDALTPS